jgi:hypothetical protein
MTTSTFSSKSATLLGTVGLAGGIFYSFKKGDNMTKVLITGGIFGLCGYLLGSAITKFYE